MKKVTQKLLEKVLKEADKHITYLDAYIEYDTESFYFFFGFYEHTLNITKEKFIYKAFDVDDNKVELSEEQIMFVFKHVKDLQDTEIEKQKELENQF
jgi:hypothetical protein